MKNDKIVSSLSQLGIFLNQFLSAKPENFNEEENKFASFIGPRRDADKSLCGRERDK